MFKLEKISSKSEDINILKANCSQVANLKYAVELYIMNDKDIDDYVYRIATLSLQT